MAPQAQAPCMVDDQEYENELVQVLAESGIKQVPPSFVQTVEDAANQGDLIPVIDMAALRADSRRELELAKLASACQEWGFFQVINHGMASTRSILKSARDFFELPLEMKRTWQKVPGQSVSNIEGYGRYNTSSQTISDWVDVLVVYTEPPSCKNIDKWPLQLREGIESYSDDLKELVLEMNCAISDTLGLSGDYINKMCGEYSSALRINFYPPCPEPDKALGVSPHSDGSTITVLCEDSGHEALQVRKNGDWVSVKVVPNSLIVNIGDIVQVISNGKYKSVEHRAVVSSEHDRISAVMFNYPSMNSHVEIFPAPPLCKDHPALYKSFTYYEYLSFYLNQKAPGKARVDSLLI
ncbi:probable 2-oxoglutarate-dependent dioxygenase ANS [Selaginella moellendorffii]|uniref:probable 2-oxoglutarate-dependent dioxygenase ANS n=1 Tax=Selaginella moellendorffii TaxID=88036 RepID=UPI000D1C2650|nr:probable 2-oxoglutarate-dependent dioxygenase ANS [Selaginella moellendorffii]|eukprot:XP_024527901.1 probable 2-oxoglutarate-dependent dioxygenase ANS [Selaginella moellendorffii]